MNNTESVTKNCERIDVNIIYVFMKWEVDKCYTNMLMIAEKILKKLKDDFKITERKKKYFNSIIIYVKKEIKKKNTFSSCLFELFLLLFSARGNLWRFP